MVLKIISPGYGVQASLILFFIYKEKAFKNYTQHYNISFKIQFLAINIKNM